MNAVSKSTAIKNAQKNQPPAQPNSPSPQLDNKNNHDDSFKSPKSPNTSLLNGSDKSSPSPPLEKETLHTPITVKPANVPKSSSNNFNNMATTPTSNNRPIIDTTKFDSLEVSLKSCSFGWSFKLHWSSFCWSLLDHWSS